MQYDVVFDSSFRRIQSAGDVFFDRFYDRFLSTSDEIRSRFSGTNMRRQKDLLKSSFFHLVNFYVSHRDNDYLKEMAHRHSRSALDIQPTMYDSWMNCLIDTVRDTDPECTNDVLLAWTVVLAPGIAYMKYHYAGPSA